MESSENVVFNPDEFSAALQAKTDEYADFQYITHGTGDSFERNQLKRENAVKSYSELLGYCVDALLSSQDIDTIMEIIDKTVVLYQYGNGSFLMFGGKDETTFYRDLARQLALKASVSLAQK